jgi:hypothetical protein
LLLSHIFSFGLEIVSSVADRVAESSDCFCLTDVLSDKFFSDFFCLLFFLTLPAIARTMMEGGDGCGGSFGHHHI